MTPRRCLDDHSLRSLLLEDAPHGDLTSESLPLAGEGALSFAARGDMQLSGLEEAARLFELAGARALVLRASGERGLQVKLAPAGGVNAANAAAYARAGADLLVSSAPYWAPPADVKVTFRRNGAA